MCPHGQEESSQKTAKLTIFLYMSLILLIFLIFYKKNNFTAFVYTHL